MESKSDNEVTIGIVEKENAYFYRNSNGIIKISNFKMVIIHFIQSNSAPVRVVEVTNELNQCVQFDMPADSMRNPDSFCKVLESKGNYIFTGTKLHLCALKGLLFQDEKAAIGLPYLGYQKKHRVFAFSNGLFDSKGVFHHPDENGNVTFEGKNFHLPLASKSADEFPENESQRLFSHQPGTVTLEQWASAYVDAFGFNGIIGLAYIFAAIHRNIIFDKLHFMPHLFLCGQPQSGKSTFRRSLMQFFGEEQKALHCGIGSTQKSLSRKLAQFANALVSVEEYKNDIDSRLIETLKGIYDGEGYERATMSNDNHTHTTSVLSSLVIAGQQLPTRENALFSRCLLAEFSKTEFEKEEVDKLEKLKSIQESKFSHLTGQIFKYQDLIKSEFHPTFQEIESHLRQRFAGKSIPDRAINNYAAVLAPFLIFEHHAVFDFSFIKEYDLLQKVVETLASQLEHLNATNEISQFWEVVKLLKDRNDLPIKKHHIIKMHEGVLCIGICFEAVSDLYRQHCITRRILGILDGRSLSTYLKQDKAYIKGKHNGGCHYWMIEDKKRSVFVFDIEKIMVDILENWEDFL